MTTGAFAETLDILRGRFMRAKGARPLADVAKEVGVARPTLVTFLHGRTSTTLTILLVEKWLDKEEHRLQQEAHRG